MAAPTLERSILPEENIYNWRHFQLSIFAIFLKLVLVTSLAPTFSVVWNQIQFDFEENRWKLVLIFWAQVYLLEGKINMFYTFIADCFDCLNFVWRLTIPLTLIKGFDDYKKSFE